VTRVIRAHVYVICYKAASFLLFALCVPDVLTASIGCVDLLLFTFIFIYNLSLDLNGLIYKKTKGTCLLVYLIKKMWLILSLCFILYVVGKYYCSILYYFIQPQLIRDYPVSLSILLTGGKENNNDSPSNGE